MKIKRSAVFFTLVGCLGLMACGANNETENATVVSTEEQVSVVGIYTYMETASFGDTSFDVPWTLELKEDGTYEIRFENMMGEHVYTGSYTSDGNKVVTDTPVEDTSDIMAGFFNEDYSCDWTLDVENVAFSPANAIGGGQSETADVQTENGYGAVEYLDVQYATVSESDTLDLYVPGNVEKAPVVVMIHGGAFMFGDKQMEIVRQCIEPALAHGYAFATINYRLSGEAVYPGAVADAKAAVRFLKANAEEYGIDGDNIFIWGESAGAYLANMVAATADVDELNGDVTDNLQYDSSVKGLISFYAPTDWYQMDADFEELGVAETERAMGLTGTDTSAESKFLGQNVMSDKAVTDAASPLNYIDGMENGEFFAIIQHGNADVNVPYMQSERLYEAFSVKYGAENVILTIIDGAVHEDDAFYTEENLNEIFTFLDSVPR